MVKVPYELRRPRNGRTIKEAAALTGLTEQTIKRWTSEPRAVYLAKADKKRVAVRKLRAEGLTMQAIADKLGCSIGTVHRYVHDGDDPKPKESSKD